MYVYLSYENHIFYTVTCNEPHQLDICTCVRMCTILCPRKSYFTLHTLSTDVFEGTVLLLDVEFRNTVLDQFTFQKMVLLHMHLFIIDPTFIESIDLVLCLIIMTSL